MRIGLFIVASLFMTGCHKVTIDTGAAAGSKTYSTSSWYFINGLAGGKEINLSEHCSSGVSQMRSKMGLGGILINSLTLGMVSKVDITITCAASASGSAPEKAPVVEMPAAEEPAEEAAPEAEAEATKAEATEAAPETAEQEATPE